MKARFPPQPAGDSSQPEYDTSSSSSLDHEAVRKGRVFRLKNQMRWRICESAEDSLGSSLLERHISRLSNHQSTACESVAKEVRGSAAWSSFIQKSTTGNSQAAPDYLGKISNSLSNSPGAYDKLRPRKSIEEHLKKDFIKLIQAFTSLPDIKCALNESDFTCCTPHAVDRAFVDKGKIRPDICIVSFTEIIGSE